MSKDLLKEEIALEEEGCLLRQQEYWASQYRLRSKKLEGKTKAGLKLTEMLVPPYAEAISKTLAEAEEKPTKLSLYLRLFSALDPYVLAFISAQAILNEIGYTRSFATTATCIGRRIQEELNYAELESSAPRLYSKVISNLKAHPRGFMAAVKRSMLNNTIRKFEIKHTEWNNAHKCHVGTALIHIFAESTGAVEIVRQRRKKGSGFMYRCVASQEILAWIEEYDRQSTLLQTSEQWMICPPEEWGPGKMGGYYLPRMKFPLIISRRRAEAKDRAESPMPEVYRAVNALQNSGFRVNTKMLEVFEQVWEAGIPVDGMPQKFDDPKPPEPEYDPQNPRPWVEWKERAGDSLRRNLTWRSQRVGVIKTRYTGNQFSPYSAMYSPVRLDFRGRAYYRPRFLQPQGDDLSRSLLLAKESKPLGVAGIRWLEIHLANTFGVDKVSFNARQDWTRSKADDIYRCADSPLDNRWWTEADSPWQFLAACMEYRRVRDLGPACESSLIVGIDGTCNGIQHLAAMSRDEEAGAQVNLVPSGKPSDIYSAVADRVVQLLTSEDGTKFGAKSKKSKSRTAEELTRFARFWLDLGITRKLVKRQVMVFPYGGTYKSCEEYTKLAVDEALKKANRVMPKDISVSYLSRVIWAAIQDLISGPTVTMNYVRSLASLCAQNGLPLRYTVHATGFKVQVAPEKMTRKKTLTKIGEKVYTVRCDAHLKEIDRRKQASSAGPHFVHSYDAACMILTVNRCWDLGLRTFLMVHDSYGTLCADMDTMFNVTRQVFRHIHESRDILEDFRQDVIDLLPDGTEVPPVPPKGDLDLSLVEISPYFFS
jgi:DNA-directed RNA polymerase